MRMGVCQQTTRCEAGYVGSEMSVLDIVDRTLYTHKGKVIRFKMRPCVPPHHKHRELIQLQEGFHHSIYG